MSQYDEIETYPSLVIHPDDRLRAVCKPISSIDESHIEIGRLLSEARVRENGAGIAAPQIGFDVRMFAVRNGDSTLVLCNPVLVEQSGDLIMSTEGCLSIPGRRFKMMRSPSVKMEFLHLSGRTLTISASGFKAVCLQHELDHLDGRLIIDTGFEVTEDPEEGPQMARAG